MLYDAAAVIYLTKTRAYNPKTGRFLERDKLDESSRNGYQGFISGKDAINTNLYAWCGNNPVTRVDPSGQSWLDLIRAAARVVIAVVQVFTYVAYNAVRQYAPAAARAIQRAATRVTTAVQQVAAPVKVIFQPAAAPSRQSVISNMQNWSTPRVRPVLRGVEPRDFIRQDDELNEARKVAWYVNTWHKIDDTVMGPGLVLAGLNAIATGPALEASCAAFGNAAGAIGCAPAVPGLIGGGAALSYSGWRLMEESPVWAPMTRKINDIFD